MPTTTSPDGLLAASSRAALSTDAQIDAAVHAFIIEVTGVSDPATAVARCYDRAVVSIVEEVTGVLAALQRQH